MIRRVISCLAGAGFLEARGGLWVRIIHSPCARRSRRSRGPKVGPQPSSRLSPTTQTLAHKAKDGKAGIEPARGELPQLLNLLHGEASSALAQAPEKRQRWEGCAAAQMPGIPRRDTSCAARGFIGLGADLGSFRQVRDRILSLTGRSFTAQTTHHGHLHDLSRSSPELSLQRQRHLRLSANNALFAGRGRDRLFRRVRQRRGVRLRRRARHDRVRYRTRSQRRSGRPSRSSRRGVRRRRRRRQHRWGAPTAAEGRLAWPSAEPRTTHGVSRTLSPASRFSRSRRTTPRRPTCCAPRGSRSDATLAITRCSRIRSRCRRGDVRGAVGARPHDDRVLEAIDQAIGDRRRQQARHRLARSFPRGGCAAQGVNEGTSLALRVRRGHLLRDDHRPRVEDSSRISASSIASRRTQTQLNRRSDSRGSRNLSGSVCTRASRHSFGNAEAHNGLVARDRRVDDLADAELDPAVDECLGRSGESQRERPHLLTSPSFLFSCLTVRRFEAGRKRKTLLATTTRTTVLELGLVASGPNGP